MLLVAVLLAGARLAEGQSGSGTVYGMSWPELDLYYRTGEKTRLYGIATYTLSPDSAVVDNAQYGINFDFFPKRRVLLKHRPAVDVLAFNRSQPLQFRAGYRYSTELGIPDPVIQNRLLFELSGRLTKGAFSAYDRNGFDLRWTEGDYSTRYRNRVWLEVVLAMGGYQPVPYVDAEWFYSVQKSEWTKVRYEAGVHLPVAGRFAVEPYASSEDYWDGSPDQRGLGLNLILSW
jgi:hypothetical protein